MKNVWERKGFQPVLMSFIGHRAKLLFTIKTLFALHTFHDPNSVPSAQNVGAININMQ